MPTPPRTAKPKRNPADPPVSDLEKVRSLAKDGKWRIEDGRDSEAYVELGERLGLTRLASKREVFKAISTLTMDNFAGVWIDDKFPSSDEFAVYIAGIGVYIKLRIAEDFVLVISCHPLKKEPLLTRCGEVRFKEAKP